MSYQIIASIIIPDDNADMISFDGSRDIKEYQITYLCLIPFNSAGVLPLGSGTVSENGVYLICR